mmetsp:Transcript_13351/g.26962  ORF Transcript_13351/g.26962 Transcript_13351/m.26962 type:complete len:120 (-) Transcript_13351:353-712(-)
MSRSSVKVFLDVMERVMGYLDLYLQKKDHMARLESKSARLQSERSQTMRCGSRMKTHGCGTELRRQQLHHYCSSSCWYTRNGQSSRKSSPKGEGPTRTSVLLIKVIIQRQARGSKNCCG